MKNTYCTLFNYDYIARGLTLYRSMERCMSEFCLYILAMDHETGLILENLKLSNAVIIEVEDILDDDLKRILGERVGPALFWTLTPIVIEYILRQKDEQWCTYIDADCFVLKDPGKVLDIIESKGYSVGIVEHRFRKDERFNELCATNGRFNVAYNTFRNDENSLLILEEWKRQCLSCCTDKPTGETFGDQLYLNEWPDKYDRVYIIEDDGIDVAPWNVNNYVLTGSKGSYTISNECGNYNVSMYHFHALRFLSRHIVSLNLWNTKSRTKEKDIFRLYREYIAELKKQQHIVDGYPICSGTSERISIADKIRNYKEKYKNREENSILEIIRNVMLI